jgi:tRNA pseudouridine38-40 synthase
VSRRILLRVAYDGTAYAGWQAQDNALAVQQVLEGALCRITGEAIRVTGASRTDAGVHALSQAVHFDTDGRIPAEKFALALNTRLPGDVRVTASREVPPGFHARFSACGKVYAYVFSNAPAASALYSRFSAHCPVPLDEAAMDRAAATLVGRHDFTAFQAAGGTAKSFVREMRAARVTRRGSLVCFLIYGTGFLYNMVRICAGTLALVGQGKLGEDAFLRAMDSGSRLDLGYTAPAKGLTLVRVLYPGQEAQGEALAAAGALFGGADAAEAMGDGPELLPPKPLDLTEKLLDGEPPLR